MEIYLGSVILNIVFCIIVGIFISLDLVVGIGILMFRREISKLSLKYIETILTSSHPADSYIISHRI